MDFRRSCITVVFLTVGLAGALVAQGGINDGLVAHFPLDGHAQDATGNGYDGSIFGDPQTVTGMVDSALRFDGVGDYVATPTFAGQATGGPEYE